MAKKSDVSQAELRKIISDIKKGSPAPVYILHGEEAYYLDLIADNIEKYGLESEEDREFNFNAFYGNDADIPYIVATAQQFPVMATRRVVMLKEAQGMSQAKSQLEKFAPYVSRPNPNTVFVIVYKGEPFKASSALIKAAKKSGAIVFESGVPQDYQLFGIVRDYANQHKINIGDKALNLMVESIGTPLSKFFGELNKLVSIVGHGKEITVADVEKNIGVSKEFTNFELVDAISTRNYPKAMRIVKYFETNPRTSQKNDPVKMVAGTLFSYFSNLVIAHYLPDKSEQAMMAEFGFRHPIQLRSIKDGLRNYSALHAVNAVHYLREFDTRSKGIESLQSDIELLDELIFKIFT